MAKCTELVRILVPWGGQILSYCPVHANQMVMMANAMGSKLSPKMIANINNTECEHTEPCTEEEKELNKGFKVHA